MDAELARKVWNRIQEAGDTLKGRLPASPRHPKGRNSYAHVAKCIKSHYGCSYKDLDDSYYDDVLNYITWIETNHGTKE